MKIYIKNMVCNRCSLVVTRELKKLRVNPISVQLGEVDLAEPLAADKLESLRQTFAELGFEILDDPNKHLIEKIKNLLIGLIQSMEIKEHFSLISFLSASLNKDYSSVSKLFTQVVGITIEQFFILRR